MAEYGRDSRVKLRSEALMTTQSARASHGCCVAYPLSHSSQLITKERALAPFLRLSLAQARTMHTRLPPTFEHQIRQICARTES